MNSPHPGTREYRNMTIRLADITVTDDLIEDVSFENCIVMGPAVLALLEDVHLNKCTFDAPGPDALFWRVPPERPTVMGAIGVRRVAFHSCRLQRIGFAIPEDQYEELAAGVGWPE